MNIIIDKHPTLSHWPALVRRKREASPPALNRLDSSLPPWYEGRGKLLLRGSLNRLDSSLPPWYDSSGSLTSIKFLHLSNCKNSVTHLV